jgi:hypothetical protein
MILICWCISEKIFWKAQYSILLNIHLFFFVFFSLNKHNYVYISKNKINNLKKIKIFKKQHSQTNPIYIYFAQFNGSAKEKIKYLFSWPKTIPTCLWEKLKNNYSCTWVLGFPYKIMVLILFF